jgi:hypothetical protein
VFKLEPVTTFEELGAAPGDSLLVVFGDLAALKKLNVTHDRLFQFWNDGGAVLIASDRADVGMLQDFNVRITGDVVHQAAQRAYLGREECPVLPVTSDKLPIFRQLRKGLASNQPSCVRMLGKPLQALADFPVSCRIVGGKGKPGTYIAGGTGQFPTCRALVIGGHGVFLNDMMAQHDNDNFAFACNCIDWLRPSPGGGKRKHALFVENGKVHERFDVPLSTLPPVPLPSSRIVNKILQGLEEENFFNRLLVAIVGRDRIMRIVLLFLSAGLLVYCVTRLVRARHRAESGVPLLPEGVTAAGEAAAIMSRRDRDVIRGGNLWEAARGLARSCFAREPWQGRGGGPPRVVAAGWWRRQRLTRQVQELWDVAYGPRPFPVPPRKFARLAAAVEEVRAALAAGTLCLEDPHP